MRILVVRPPTDPPLGLSPRALIVAERHRRSGHTVEIRDDGRVALEDRLRPASVASAMATARRRLQSLERQHALSADDAVIHRSLADTVPVAEVVASRLPGAMTRLFTREAWIPVGTAPGPPALADATVLRVALALTAPSAPDPGKTVAGDGYDLVVSAGRADRGSDPGEEEVSREHVASSMRIPLWAPWVDLASPTTYMWSVAGGGRDPHPPAPGEDVVGVELRLDPADPDMELIQWAGTLGLPVRVLAPRHASPAARAGLAAHLGDLGGRPGVEVTTHPIWESPEPGAARVPVFRDRSDPAAPWFGFADAVRVVQAAGPGPYRDLMDRRLEREGSPAPPSPDVVVAANPDTVLVRLAHDPTRDLHGGGVGRTAGEQVKAGLTPGRGYPFAYDLTRRRRVRLGDPARAVALLVDGERTVGGIARELSGGVVDDRLVTRTAAVLTELDAAGVVTFA